MNEVTVGVQEWSRPDQEIALGIRRLTEETQRWLTEKRIQGAAGIKNFVKTPFRSIEPVVKKWQNLAENLEGLGRPERISLLRDQLGFSSEIAEDLAVLTGATVEGKQSLAALWQREQALTRFLQKLSQETGLTHRDFLSLIAPPPQSFPHQSGEEPSTPFGAPFGGEPSKRDDDGDTKKDTFKQKPASSTGTTILKKHEDRGRTLTNYAVVGGVVLLMGYVFFNTILRPTIQTVGGTREQPTPEWIDLQPKETQKAIQWAQVALNKEPPETRPQLELNLRWGTEKIKNLFRPGNRDRDLEVMTNLLVGTNGEITAENIYACIGVTIEMQRAVSPQEEPREKYFSHDQFSKDALTRDLKKWGYSDTAIKEFLKAYENCFGPAKNKVPNLIKATLPQSWQNQKPRHLDIRQATKITRAHQAALVENQKRMRRSVSS